MSDLPPVPLIGREAELERFTALLKPSAGNGAGYLWVVGPAGSGKSRFLDTCVERAAEAGWETLQGRCSEETRTDPYGPFLSTLGLCFDRFGKLINDRSVYTIVDQISLDDVFNAVNDIPGMAVVAFGIKVGMSIFEARRRPRSSDELLNRNFEFILQVLEQISRKRKKPILLALDDLHLASTTTYALIEYLLTRIEDTRLLIVATWSASSAEEGEVLVRERLPRLAQSDRLLNLPPLSDAHMRRLLRHLYARPPAEPLAATLIRLSRGLPGVLTESLRLVELEGETCLSTAEEWITPDSALRTLIARQVNRLNEEERAILECASLIGQRVPLSVLGAPPLCAYLGLSERALLMQVVELADRAGVLAWEGEGTVRFISPSVHQFLRERVHEVVARRDHLRIAEAWQAVGDGGRPAQLAAHYLAGGELQKALEFALQSAEELSRRAAYPEAMQSYHLALEALEQMGEEADDDGRKCDILLAMGLVAEQAGDWAQAMSALEEALSLAEDDARRAEIHAGLGWLHVQRGEVQAALENLNRSAALYEALGDAPGRAQVDYYLGVLYQQQKEWQRAIACFERYLEVSRQAGFSEGRASAYIELGNLYRLQRRWEQAERLLKRGIELARQDEDYAVLAQGYHYLGVLYSWQGRTEAVETLHRALDIVRTRTRQPAQEARIQNTLAETLVRMNRWAEAEAAFHSSATIKERLGDKAGLAMTYGGLGRLYLRRWMFDRAAEYLQKDIEILSEEFAANVAWIQQLTNTLGEVYRRQGNLKLAAECLERALELAESIPDPGVRERSLGYTHMLRANLALDAGDIDIAEQECARALELLAGTWAAGDVNRTAARLARTRGDLERARQYLERALSAARHGEDIDRALVSLEWAYLCRDAGDREGVRKWAEQVMLLARRLENVGLQHLAGQLLDDDSVIAPGCRDM